MSEKQLGAAPGEENARDVGRRVGWFGRLRAQPGFRTASIAFVLTVVLGIGSTAAYAYWSQRNTVTQSVNIVRQPLPAVAKPQCNDRYLFTTVGWSPPAGMPSDAVYIVQISTSRGTVDYAFPRNTTEFRPADLRIDGQPLFYWMGPRTGTVTVSTAFLAPGVAVPGVVNPDTQVLNPPSERSPATSLTSRTSGWAWFEC